LPIALILNLAVLGCIRAQGGSRAGWAGFLAAGLLGLVAFGWAALTPNAWGPSLAGAPNQVRFGSRLWESWNSYTMFTANGLQSFGLDPRTIDPGSLDRPRLGYILFVGLTALIPQLFLALLGGVIARSVARWLPTGDDEAPRPAC
jgi:hypothetical protein